MKRVVGVVAVVVLVLGFGMSVSGAVPPTIYDYHLKTPHENQFYRSSEWETFPAGEGSCEGVTLYPGQVLWQFVLSGGNYGKTTPATAANTVLDAFGQTNIPPSGPITGNGKTAQWLVTAYRNANTGTNTVAHSDGSPGVQSGTSASLKVGYTCEGPPPTPPTLRVQKTIGEANGDGVDFPDDTEFTVKVTCTAPPRERARIGAQDFSPTFSTELTFDEEGHPESADPQGGWHKQDDAWVLQSKDLTYKLCVAEETDIEQGDHGDNGVTAVVNEDDVEVAYQCEASADPDHTIAEVAVEGFEGAPFGCVRPLPAGEYDDDAEDAAVQFSAPWDHEACQASPQEGCLETGTLTVDNTWNPPEEAPVTPTAIAVAPTFTG